TYLNLRQHNKTHDFYERSIKVNFITFFIPNNICTRSYLRLSIFNDIRKIVNIFLAFGFPKIQTIPISQNFFFPFIYGYVWILFLHEELQ
ncbi:hypothetical protein ACJX0J_021342, partial [Zea mays]